MRIDIQYLSYLLRVFLDADTAHINIKHLDDSGIKTLAPEGRVSEIFLFHFQLAIENQLISNMKLEAKNLSDTGMIVGSLGDVALTGTSIRLTQKGHDFASALSNKEVLQRLKSEFKDAPFKVLFDGGQKLLIHFAKKKIDEITAN